MHAVNGFHELSRRRTLRQEGRRASLESLAYEAVTVEHCEDEHAHFRARADNAPNRLPSQLMTGEVNDRDIRGMLLGDTAGVAKTCAFRDHLAKRRPIQNLTHP
jgi:hypothetical protein